jgi:homoaconitate hydratase family protein
MGKTFAQKILGRAAGREVGDGDIVFVEPDFVLTHDNTAAIIDKFEATVPGGSVRYPDRLAIVLDHVVPAASSKDAAGHRKIRGFVREQGIEHFYDAGTGICHQVLPEQGLVAPGSIIVGSDSHTCTYGAFNAFATGIDRTEAAGLWITGRTWFRVPPTISIDMTGHLTRRISAKDLILRIIGDLGADGANYMAVEFHGPSIGSLRMSDRMTIANMGIEMGAKLAVFPADRTTQEYIRNRGPDASRTMWSDVDAEFADVRRYDLEELEPMIAMPHNVDNVAPVTELLDTEVDQVFLGTCTNGRLDDLEAALEVMGNRRVHENVRMIVGPASREVYLKAERKGLLAEFVEAGAMVIPPGCGPCLGAHMGALAPGERCLSTANRNFQGRMGEKEAEIYLGSPETAAATAVAGRIADPREVL